VDAVFGLPWGDEKGRLNLLFSGPSDTLAAAAVAALTCMGASCGPCWGTGADFLLLQENPLQEKPMTASTARTCPTNKPPAVRARRAWTAALLLPLITGCATTGVVPLGSATRAAKPADCRLDVFAAREDVRRPFDAVCLVSSESGRTLFNDRSDEGRLQAAREAACACGADAIIVRDMSRSAMQFGVGYSQARIKIEAIAYRP
jgi:hypothetical protein